jgi:hypothetical protein
MESKSALSYENISCKCSTDKTVCCSVMLSKAYSEALVGIEAFEVEIEVLPGGPPAAATSTARLILEAAQGQAKEGC